MQKPRRKPWATRQRGRCSRWTDKESGFMNTALFATGTWTEMTYVNPTLSLNTWSAFAGLPLSHQMVPGRTSRTWCCRLVRLSTRLLLPLETQSPRVCCQNLKLLLLYSSLGEAVNTPKSTWCCKWLRSNCLHTWHSMASNSEFKWRYCMEEIRRTSWGW